MSGNRTIVLGGGVGGIVASQVLKKALGKDMQVTLIDKDDKHHFASSYPLLLINKRKPEHICRELVRLERKGVEFLRAEITGINPAKKEVATDKGAVKGDYLVISLGVEYNPDTVPGFSRYAYNVYDFNDVIKIAERLSCLEEGHIVLFISSLPFKCPPAPYEIMFLMDQFFRQRGIRDKIELTLVTPEPSPEPLAGPLVGQSVRKMLAERRIKLRTQAKVLSLEPGTLILDQGDIKADLFLGIASHRTPQVLRETDLVNEEGWVKVNPHTLQTAYPSVYAVGDATAIRLPVMQVYAPKAGIFAHYQAEVAARNIALEARGKKPVHRFTGKGL